MLMLSHLSEGFLTLFQDKPIRKSRHQLHFEKREVLDVQFTLKTCTIGNADNLFGVELAINQTKISGYSRLFTTCYS